MNPEIFSRSGLALKLIGRRNVREVWALRLDDKALRSYFNSDLRCFITQHLVSTIATLPLMRPARAKEAAELAAKEIKP